MATFKVETKNKINIDKKPRVYFTCHPDDFEKHFKKVCDDIFKTHDCAVYYTEDMNETINDDEKEVDLGRSNLFVVPVTYKLLSTPNRAMNEDIPYALKEHIPVLPIMMESGIDEFYSKKDKFNEIQYLNPYSTDLTEISYKEKLKKYLDSVLISNELVKRIQKVFDAYIFLSYRKKDRKYANELMRLIHSNPECRDIAIWFDEFIIPGESFRKNIERMLNDCSLFTLLITPRLLEKVINENGEEKDNYVISTELPLAYKKKEEKDIEILAVEMEDTDEKKLYDMNIRDYINVNDSDFRNRLLNSISRLTITVNNDPEHIFLVGLAYLNGIEVETDIKKGLRLIEDSANAELKEAMKMLVNIYYFGIGTKKDLIMSINYQRKYIASLKKKAQDSPSCFLEYLSEELNLAEIETEAELLKESRNTCWRVIKQCRSNEGYGAFFSEDRIEYYIRAYILLGKMFSKRGDIVQSKECYEKANKLLNQLTEDKKDIINDYFYGCLYFHLGEIYSSKPFYDYRYNISNYKKALDYFDRCDHMSSEQKVQDYIDKCKIKLAAEYEKYASKTEEAIQIYLDLSSQYTQLDYQSHLDATFIKAHCFYRLGFIYHEQNNITDAKKAYQNVINISEKVLEINEDDTLFMRLFLLSSVKFLKVSDVDKNVDEYRRLFQISEAYCKRILTRDTQQLVAELCFELADVEIGYLKKSYDIYENLYKKYPEFYSSDFWKFRRYMWNSNLLDQSYFKKKTLLVISHDEGGFICCIDPLSQIKYNFRLSFVLCKPIDEIQKITITDYKCHTLKGISVSNQQIEPPSNLLQICPIETSSSNSDIISDEHILLSYKNGEEVEYIFCYG